MHLNLITQITLSKSSPIQTIVTGLIPSNLIYSLLNAISHALFIFVVVMFCHADLAILRHNIIQISTS